MKSLLALTIIGSSVLFSGCEFAVTERRPVHRSYVGREPDHDRYDRGRVYDRRDVVVRRYEAPRHYYHDRRGRYYQDGGRRIYVNL